MTVSEYSDLKRQIVVSVGTNERYDQILNSLKEFYYHIIDSQRRFERINKIGELLNILEVRDVLSKDDLRPLKEIATRLPNKIDLLRKIDEFEEARRHHENNNGSEETLNSSTRQQGVSPLYNHPLGNLTDRKKQRIIDTVVEEIGTNWRDLARNLKIIRECTIDEIDSKNNSLEGKAVELMEKFEQRADPQRWFFVLCNALDRTRRKDLSKSLQHIMTMNI